MVSKASDDLPDPDRPVITTSWSRGRSTSIFLRLWTRAPRTFTQSCAMLTVQISSLDPNSYFTTHGPRNPRIDGASLDRAGAAAAGAGRAARRSCGATGPASGSAPCGAERGHEQEHAD